MQRLRHNSECPYHKVRQDEKVLWKSSCRRALQCIGLISRLHACAIFHDEVKSSFSIWEDVKLPMQTGLRRSKMVIFKNWCYLVEWMTTRSFTARYSVNAWWLNTIARELRERGFVSHCGRKVEPSEWWHLSTQRLIEAEWTRAHHRWWEKDEKGQSPVPGGQIPRSPGRHRNGPDWAERQREGQSLHCIIINKNRPKANSS